MKSINSKTILAAILALAGPVAMSGCVTVKQQRESAPHVTRTTTEQTTVNRPRSRTVETQTVRTY